MAKLGQHDYPGDMGPEEAREAVEVLVNDFGGEAGSEEAFAQAIGHTSTNSGTYLRKRGDMRKYGLMEPRSIVATEFGREAADPTNEEHKEEILFQMLQNIELLSSLYETLNGTEPDVLWQVLTEITEADPNEAQEAEGKIEALYLKMLQYEPDEESTVDTSTGTDTEETGVGSTGQTKKVPAESTIESTPAQPTGVFVRVGNDELKLEEVTDTNIELAKQFLESKKGGETDAVQMRFG